MKRKLIHERLIAEVQYHLHMAEAYKDSPRDQIRHMREADGALRFGKSLLSDFRPFTMTEVQEFNVLERRLNQIEEALDGRPDPART